MMLEAWRQGISNHFLPLNEATIFEHHHRQPRSPTTAAVFPYSRKLRCPHPYRIDIAFTRIKIPYKKICFHNMPHDFYHATVSLSAELLRNDSLLKGDVFSRIKYKRLHIET
jgi:hypothetical protein